MTPPNDNARETRSVEVELEVPGTPEQVWEAIATGPGISAWFVPTEVGEGEGGTISQNHGVGMEAAGSITAWDPPRRFAYSTPEFQPTEEASPQEMAVEFLVEARSGGTCVVRIVNSGFGTGDDWDRAFESVHGGWSSALRGLRLYLTNFAGESHATIAAGGTVARSKEQAWAALTDALGISAAAVGGSVATSAPGAPLLAGVVERVTEGELLLRIDEPGRGMAHIGAGGPGDTTFAFVRLYLFGDEAVAIAGREEPAWHAWMAERFPSAPEGDGPPARRIEVAVEVPGTPEQVWEAIATGPGISAWFVPTEVAEGEGGTISQNHGAGMEAVGTITVWEPPRRFAAEEDWQPPGVEAPGKLATEYLVEARSGGTCVVRLVNSVFADADAWSDELESMREGWGLFLANLRLYLTHFAGQRCSPVVASGHGSGSRHEAWEALRGALGLPEAGEGERAGVSAPGAPGLAGVVERVERGPRHHRGLMLRIDDPAPGTALVFVNDWHGRVFVNVLLYLFGDETPTIAAREAPVWQAWMDARFPAVQEARATS